MAKVALQRTLTGWLPANEEAADWCRKFKAGTVCVADLKRARNYREHCLFMCLLDKTYENLPEKLVEKWPTDRDFRSAVALKAGHCYTFVSSDGEQIRVPLRYSYDELPDEDSFIVEFGRAMSVCATLIDFTNDELAAEISRYAFERFRVQL